MNDKSQTTRFDLLTALAAVVSLFPCSLGVYWALLGFGIIEGGDSAGWGYALGIAVMIPVSLICFAIMAIINARGGYSVSKIVLFLGFGELALLGGVLILIYGGR